MLYSQLTTAWCSSDEEKMFPTRAVFVLLVLLMVSAEDEDSPEGIDVEDGDPEVLFNRTYSQEQTELDKFLYRGNSFIRPLQDPSHTMYVDVHFHITHVSIDQEQQTITINGHLYMSWTNELIGWDPAEFHGIKRVITNKWFVWRPKLHVTNSASGVLSEFNFARQSHVTIQTLGKGVGARVEMYPKFSVKAGCYFDYSKYPNEENKCSVSLFTHEPVSEISLRTFEELPPTVMLGWDKYDDKLMVSSFAIGNVTNSVLYYVNGTNVLEEPKGRMRATAWSVLHCTISFVRQEPVVIIALYLPSVVTILLNIVAFFVTSIPTAVFILIANIVAQAIFLQDFVHEAPPAVGAIPFPVLLFAVIMVTNFATLIQHFILLHLQTKTTTPPIWLTPSEAEGKSSLLKLYTEDSKCSNWIEAVKRLRAVSLYVVCTVYFITFIAYFIY